MADDKNKPQPAPAHPGGRPASDATCINVDQRGPIAPSMPNYPPA